MRGEDIGSMTQSLRETKRDKLQAVLEGALARDHFLSAAERKQYRQALHALLREAPLLPQAEAGWPEREADIAWLESNRRDPGNYPFQNLRNTVIQDNARIDRLLAIARSGEGETDLKPVAWRTRGMTGRGEEWAEWHLISEERVALWKRDPSFKNGRREIEPLYAAPASPIGGDGALAEAAFDHGTLKTVPVTVQNTTWVIGDQPAVLNTAAGDKPIS